MIAISNCLFSPTSENPHRFFKEKSDAINPKKLFSGHPTKNKNVT